MAGKLLVLDTVPKYTMSLFPKSMRNADEVSVFRRPNREKRWFTHVSFSPYYWVLRGCVQLLSMLMFLTETLFKPVI